jgi:hypothetical protein
MSTPIHDPRIRLKACLASGEARLLPLSLTQRELWENPPVPPGDPVNHICATIEIRGTIAFDLCEEALRAVVQRQEVLRTSFLSGRDKTAQIVFANIEASMCCRDVGPGNSLDVHLSEIFSRPFDMVRGPLFRAEILRITPDHHVLALVFHHAIADGWTLGVFVEDFSAAYILALKQSGRAIAQIRGVREGLPPPGLTYSAWAAQEKTRWHQSEIDRLSAYWKTRLEGSKQLFAEPATGGEIPPLCKRVTTVPSSIVTAARATAKQLEVTPFSLLLTAFQIALFEWKGIEDIVLGVPHANRLGTKTRDTMGYFAGVIPIRLQLEPGRTFSATLAVNHAVQIEDFAHAMPFAELASALTQSLTPTRHRIFDVRFAFQNHPVPDIELPGISTRLRTIATGTSRFDIACEMTEYDGSLEVVWLYRRPLVSEEDITQLDGLLQSVLEEAGQNPETRIQGPLSTPLQK